MAEESTIHIPFTTDSKTGTPEYTETQLTALKPIWYSLWRECTPLDEDTIRICVEEIHTGPFEWPGTRIAEGAGRGMTIFMDEIKHEWKKEGRAYTGGQVYTEAKSRLTKKIKREAGKRGIEDPYIYEYYLTQKERKKNRTPDDLR